MGVYKVNVSLDEALVSEIDQTAHALGVSRSGFIAQASARYLAEVHARSAEELRRQDIERAIHGFKRIRSELPEGYDFDYVAQIRADRRRHTHRSRSE